MTGRLGIYEWDAKKIIYNNKFKYFKYEMLWIEILPI
jgi:hypothetical protein